MMVSTNQFASFHEPISATMNTRIFLTTLLALSALLPLGTHAADPVSSPSGSKPFANVSRLRGDVFATGKSGAPRKLQEGASVYVGEQVKAAPNGEAVLKTADAGVVAVRPGAEFVMERFSAEGKTSDHQVVRLISGSLRIISGWIAKLNRDEHRVVTPNATIGIRGTDHEPFVLPAEMATNQYRQGTYDKVNRGGTSLNVNEASINIDSGRVGFARDPNAAGGRSRALMTLLLPVLLTKVPEFYVPGTFDRELDNYSENADALSLKQLERTTGYKPPAIQKAAPAPQAEVAGTATALTAEPPPSSIVGCNPLAIGSYWLARLDGAIVQRDIKTILGLFASDIVAKATVRSGTGVVTMDFERDEMVRSTLSSVASLKNYQQRRISKEATWAENETADSCNQIVVKSVVIEQGLMNAKPYRFEALEEYVLEKRQGEWLAIKAHTTQR